MTIKIKGVEYSVKYTLRAMFIYEKVSGHSFSVTTTLESFLYFFCLLLANNPSMKLTFEEFIDECDTNPEVQQQFQDFLQERNNRDKFLEGNKQEADGAGEKKS